MPILPSAIMPPAVFLVQDNGSYLICGIRLLSVAEFSVDLLPRIQAAIDFINGDSIAEDILSLFDICSNLPASFGAGTQIEWAANAENRDIWSDIWVSAADYYIDRVDWSPCLIMGNIEFDWVSLSQAVGVGVSIIYSKARRTRPPTDISSRRFIQRLGGLWPDVGASLYMPLYGSEQVTQEYIVGSFGLDYSAGKSDYIQATPAFMSLCSAALIAGGGAEAWPDNFLVRGETPDSISYNGAGQPLLLWESAKYEPNLYIAPAPAESDYPVGLVSNGWTVGKVEGTTWSMSGKGCYYSPVGISTPCIYAGVPEEEPAVAISTPIVTGLAAAGLAAIMRIKLRRMEK